MSKIDRLKNYILETDFKVTILEGKVDVINYTSIEHFDLNKVMIEYSKGLLIITGNNLVVTKLVTDEILITGIIKNIEFR